ncbi:MAG: PEP-CTERM sorting domain-containing protein [Fimbriimonadaceae bacterium]|nr:MAG: PEP-CTERM sorting domain-containing protein [Fimbriimonadaceae bacterium]
MRNTILIAALAVVGTASAQSLYNNATPAGLTAEGLRTGSRPAGGSYSEVQNPNTNAGYLAQATQARIGDDFTVGGPGWIVNSVNLFTYQTGATTTTITGGSFEIRSGSVTGAVVGTGTFGGVTNTDIYRIFNAQPADNRRVQMVTVNFGALNLVAGNYWLTYDLVGSGSFSGPWVPTLTKVGAGTTTGANAQQFFSGAWAGLVDAGGPQDTPFWINGQVVPEPASMIALGAGIAALVARRKKA